MARKLDCAPEVGGAETTRAYELVPRIGIVDVLPEEGPEPGVTGLTFEDADGTDIFSTGPFQLDGQVVVGQRAAGQEREEGGKARDHG